MTPEQIDEWLVSIDKDRAWLAAKLGISMGTLYNGFSKGFSPRSMKAITTLVQDQSASGDLELKFTDAEFDRIEEARRLLGIATRKLFYEEAITEYAGQIIARENAQKKAENTPNLHPFPHPQQQSKAAEDEGKYNDKTGTED